MTSIFYLILGDNDTQDRVKILAGGEWNTYSTVSGGKLN